MKKFYKDNDDDEMRPMTGKRLPAFLRKKPKFFTEDEGPEDESEMDEARDEAEETDERIDKKMTKECTCPKCGYSFDPNEEE